MARPKQFDHAVALDVAMQEFWHKGYSGVSVKSLCEKLAITRSSFYNHFGSLEKVFEESIERYLSYNPMQELENDCVDAGKAIRNCFRILCKLRAKDSHHRGCLLINHLRENQQLPEHSRQRLEEKIDGMINDLEIAVNRAQRERLISPELDSRALALSLQTLATGINTISTYIHKERDLYLIADTTLSGLGL